MWRLNALLTGSRRATQNLRERPLSRRLVDRSRAADRRRTVTGQETTFDIGMWIGDNREFDLRDGSCRDVRR